MTPGPYRMIDTSKPLRTRRVEVSRLTSDTEPSNGTEWMKTNAFSPGFARMSSNSFSSVLYSDSPGSARGDSTVIGMAAPDCRVGLWTVDTFVTQAPGPRGRFPVVHVMRWLPGMRRMIADRRRQGTAR